jgi:hypothetical protein
MCITVCDFVLKIMLTERNLNFNRCFFLITELNGFVDRQEFCQYYYHMSIRIKYLCTEYKPNFPAV